MATPALELGDASDNAAMAGQFQEQDPLGQLPQPEIDGKQPVGDSIHRITLGDSRALLDRVGAFNGGLHTENRGRTKNEGGAGTDPSAKESRRQNNG